MPILRPRTCALIACIAAPASAGSIGYAQASGYLKKDSRPTLYQPLNLLDGRDATAWCSATSDPLNELLSFGFNGEIRLDELRISSGNNFDANTWKDHSRASKLIIRSGKWSQTLTLDDLRGLQSVKLRSPIQGSRFTIEILDAHLAEDPDAPVCLTDIIFVSEGRALNGPWLTTKLKYEKWASRIMGTWYAGFEGTPDRFLALNFDGSFRFDYQPFDPTRNKAKVIEGAYDVGSSRIVFEIDGKKYGVKYSRDPAKKVGFTLSFDGELREELRGAWRSLP